MNLTIHSLTTNAPFLKQAIISLTPLQKKVLTVVLGVFSIMACLSAVRFYCQKKLRFPSSQLFDPQEMAKHPVIPSDKLQYFTDYPQIDPSDMTASIMTGTQPLGSKFLAFRIRSIIPPSKYQSFHSGIIKALPKDHDQNALDERVLILFQRTSVDPTTWTVSFPGVTLPVNPFPKNIFDIIRGPVHDAEKESFKNLQELIKTGHLDYKGCRFELY